MDVISKLTYGFSRLKQAVTWLGRPPAPEELEGTESGVVGSWGKAVHWLSRLTVPLSRTFNYIGMFFIMAMMLLTTTDIILRKFFQSPISGSFELSEKFLGILVAGALGYCAIRKAHVRVEVLTHRFSPRPQAILESVFGFMSMALVALMAWRTVVYVQVSIFSGRYTPVLEIPIYPFAIVLVIGFTVFTLVLLIQWLNSLSRVLRRGNDD